MTHLRETFPVLEAASGEGEVLSLALAGQAAAGKQGLLGFSFKDSAGNFVLPTLTSDGKLQVTSEGAGAPKSGSSEGEVAGSLTLTTVAEVDLVASKNHGQISALVSCFKEAIFYLVQLDDVTETIIGHAIVGAGHYNATINLGATEIVSGASGTQKLILKAKNLNKLSDFLGSVACLEFAV